MKKILLLCLLPWMAQAQTNVIFGTAADVGLRTVTGHPSVTIQLIAPVPRFVGNTWVTSKQMTSQIDTNGNFAFTNVIAGLYRATASGALGETVHFWVYENTTNRTPFGKLVSNDDTEPPNPGTNYYTQAQVDALIAVSGGGSGGSSNGVFVAAGTNMVAVTNLATGLVTFSALTTNLPGNVFLNGITPDDFGGTARFVFDHDTGDFIIQKENQDALRISDSLGTVSTEFAFQAATLSGALGGSNVVDNSVTTNKLAVSVMGQWRQDATNAAASLKGITNYGDLNLSKLLPMAGKIAQSRKLRTLTLGDSTGRFAIEGGKRFFERSIGINGTGVGTGGPLPFWSMALAGNYSTVNTNKPITETNWWGSFYYLSNGATAVINRFGFWDADSSVAITTNALADTATFVCVKSVGAGTLSLQIATNGGAFGTVATADCNGTGLLITNIALSTNYFSMRVLGAGGGFGSAGFLGGGLYQTNGTGLLGYWFDASGHGYDDWTLANSNSMAAVIRAANPDIVVIQDRWTWFSNAVYQTLTNNTTAPILLIGGYAAIGGGPVMGTFNDASNYWSSALTYGLPFLDVFGRMNDTNEMAALGFYADGIHLNQAGENYEFSVLAGQVPGLLPMSKAINSPTGTEGGINGQDIFGPGIGIGTPNPWGKLDVKDISGSSYDVITSVNTNQGAMSTYVVANWDPNVDPRLGNTNQLWGTQPGSTAWWMCPGGGIMAFGLINSFGGHPYDERGRFRADGSFVVGDLFEAVASSHGAGTIAAQNGIWADGGGFTGVGSGLTALNASALSSGTVPLAQLPGQVLSNYQSTVTVFTNALEVSNQTFQAGMKLDTNGNLNTTGNIAAGSFSGSAASLTSLQAAQLTGTVADARLSANVALLSSGSLTNPINSASGSIGQLTISLPLTNTLWISNSTYTTGIALTPAGNISAQGTVVAQGFESPTNAWAINSSFPLGQSNQVYASSATATLGVAGIANGPTSTERFGQLTIISTGTITFTNPVSFHCSDHVNSRVVGSGTNLVIAIDVIPGLATNMAVAPF